MPVLAVGGALRSLFWGMEVKDWDFIVDTDDKNYVRSLAERFCSLTGYALVSLDPERGFYRAAGRGTSAGFDFCCRAGKNIEDDLLRRDFTVNSLALSLHNGQIFDVCGSFNDLEKRLLRAVGPHSVEEDLLRALRGVRFASKFSLDIESSTEDIIRKGLGKIWGRIAPERILPEAEAVCCLDFNDSGGVLEKCGFFAFISAAGSSAGGEKSEFPGNFNPEKLCAAFDRVCSMAETILPASGSWLVSSLKEKHRSGRSAGAVSKAAVLCGLPAPEVLSARLAVSGDEAKMAGELRSSVPELLSMALHEAPPRFRYDFCRHYNFIAEAAAWTMAVMEYTYTLPGGGAELSAPFFRRAGSFKWISNNVKCVESADRQGSVHVYLDAFLRDYAEGGPVSRPRVPLNGGQLCRILGIPPGPKVGELLRRLACECAERSLSAAQAAELAGSWLSGPGAADAENIIGIKGLSS